MKLTSFASSISEIDLLKESCVSEVILSTKVFSRFGKLEIEKAIELADYAHSQNMKSIFEWDILHTQDILELNINMFSKLPISKFDYIRVQDSGVLEFLKENYPEMKLQLNLEAGNHNLIGIDKWIEVGGNNLDRIILSIELPKNIIEKYINEFKGKTQIEILGLGRILLFYTPRSLVSPNLDKNIVDDYIEITGSSEESPHKGFPIIENRHGTFMFNTKDHCLLENIQELKEMELDYFRVDLRWYDNFNLIQNISNLVSDFTEAAATEIRSSYPVTVIRGFYNVNKSDGLFKKLKNWRTQREDESYLGEVVDVVKKKHIGILIKNTKNQLKQNCQIIIKTPDGRTKIIDNKSVFDSTNNEVDQLSNGQVAFIKHIGGVSVKSQVYLSI